MCLFFNWIHCSQTFGAADFIAKKYYLMTTKYIHTSILIVTQIYLFIYFCMQALTQCEMTLTNLGVIKVGAPDTAGAAQV